MHRRGTNDIFPCKSALGEVDAEKLMTEGPPEGKEHHKPELYCDGIMKGAHLVAKECTKDIVFP